VATVLVVDDQTASREIARATLDHGGHQVIEATDGHQVLHLATTSHPDLVLTDLLMPGMDGYQFVRELRSHQDTARIPVLFYTANYREDEAHPLAKHHRSASLSRTCTGSPATSTPGCAKSPRHQPRGCSARAGCAASTTPGARLSASPAPASCPPAWTGNITLAASRFPTASSGG
jgi:CheY-like chemotaxis protein